MLTLRKRGLLLEYSGLGVWRYLKNVDEVMSPRFFCCNFHKRIGQLNIKLLTI